MEFIEARNSLGQALHYVDDALISTKNATLYNPGEAKFAETHDRLLALKAQFKKDVDRVLEPIKSELEAEEKRLKEQPDPIGF